MIRDAAQDGYLFPAARPRGGFCEKIKHSRTLECVESLPVRLDASVVDSARDKLLRGIEVIMVPWIPWLPFVALPQSANVFQ